MVPQFVLLKKKIPSAFYPIYDLISQMIKKKSHIALAVGNLHNTLMMIEKRP